MRASRTCVRAPSWTRALVGIGRVSDATSQYFVVACVVIVSAGATGLAGVRAMAVACGAGVGRGRGCARSVQTEVGQRFRKVGEEKAVARAQRCHPVVGAQMWK